AAEVTLNTPDDADAPVREGQQMTDGLVCPRVGVRAEVRPAKPRNAAVQGQHHGVGFALTLVQLLAGGGRGNGYHPIHPLARQERKVQQLPFPAVTIPEWQANATALVGSLGDMPPGTAARDSPLIRTSYVPGAPKLMVAVPRKGPPAPTASSSSL